MKTRLVSIFIALTEMVCGSQSVEAKEPSGFQVGVTGGVSLNPKDNDVFHLWNKFWNLGVAAGYRYDFSPWFYVQPEVGIEYNKYILTRIYTGPLPQQNYNMFGAYVAANVGFEVGKGWSVFTGPQLRYTYTNDYDNSSFVLSDGSLPDSGYLYDLDLKRNQVSGQWVFGINKDIGHLYLNARFALQMTKVGQNGLHKEKHKDRNFFRFGVGWNF